MRAAVEAIVIIPDLRFGKRERRVGIGREARDQARLQDAAVGVVFVAQALIGRHEVAVSEKDQQVARVVLHVLGAHAGDFLFDEAVGGVSNRKYYV